MGTLSFTATISLDGFATDADGDFRWSSPSAEVFDFHVERMAAVSTEVLGRRAYELMRYWEAEPPGEEWGPAEREFARRWCALELVVASTTLTPAELSSERARLVPRLDLAELERLVAEAPGEVEIFGPTTAAEAIRAGLVRDFRLFVVPQTLGGGLPALPPGAVLDLALVEQRVFANGTVLLHYAAR
ncbi:dihydrofolate reductase family protein [Leucobacter allii]|uniref:Dihydrofolate reductase family protein n=1 Tax=Leucobacter allii TaxID=2932247 RepID=A0ABY4FL30_9MICO|nr:dihydrofolate reductase family protein [Leucobacter allii]UOQ56974.1 dihydrofolate reductase family protein [Leucobacter allii]